MTALNQALDARLLVSITFHYRADRLRYLFETVKALSNFQSRSLDIVIVTNTDDVDEIGAIKRVCAPLVAFDSQSSDRMKSLSVESFPGLQDPWHLPWMHKPFISERFLAARSDYTHYVNLEDDIQFSFANFTYFLKYRAPLKKHGLLPSFIRVEYNYTSNALYCTDQFHVTHVGNRRHVVIDGMHFMNIENPHIAMFVLDREAAEEYVRSRSFDLETSKEVHSWHTCERSSMALCFERVPAGFYCRYVLPVDPETLALPSQAFVYHVANNYTNNPEHPHGKHRVDALFWK